MKAARVGLAERVREVVNASLRLEMVSPMLKEAVFRPVLKKSLYPFMLENIWSVANLLFLRKVLEQVVTSQLQEFMEENDFLDNFNREQRLVDDLF